MGSIKKLGFLGLLLAGPVFGQELPADANKKDDKQELPATASFLAVQQDFAAATNSQNREHVYQKLLTEPDRRRAAQEAQRAVEEFADKGFAGSSVAATQQLIYKDRLEAALNSEVLTQVKRFKVLTDIFARTDNSLATNTPRAQVKEHTLSDLRVSKGNFFSELQTVGNLIFSKYLQTKSGLARAAFELRNPCAKVADIQAKQRQIQWLLDHPDELKTLQKCLQQMNALEKEWVNFWFLEKRDLLNFLRGSSEEKEAEAKKFDFSDWYEKQELSAEEQTAAPQMMGLNFIKKPIVALLEQSDTGMLIKAAGMLLPDVTFNVFVLLVSAGVFRLFYRFAFPTDEEVGNIRSLRDLTEAGGKGLVSVGAYLASWSNLIAAGIAAVVGTTLHIAKLPSLKVKFDTLFKRQAMLIKMRQLNNVIAQITKLLPKDVFVEVAEQAKGFVELQSDARFNEDTDFGVMMKNLSTKTFAGKPGWKSHYGRILRTLKTFEEHKEKFGHMMQTIGLMDCYAAVAQMIKDSQAGGNGFCLANVVDSDEVIFNCKGMWDVFIDPQQAVPNDVALGQTEDGHIAGTLVSGPNYGGKSVYLRGMITAAFLVQCFGFAPANSLTMTPYDCFNTYINVQDDPAAKESLFSAEMLRIESLITSIENAAKEGRKVFIVADELLTGTKPKYAEALVRSVLELISSYNNVVCIFASHFDGVIHNVVKDTAGRFDLLHVGANVDDQGFYAAPTYTISTGPSTIDSALFVAEQKLAENHRGIVMRAKELLKQQGL